MWEYLIIRKDWDSPYRLNDYGAIGWELVTTNTYVVNGKKEIEFIFKKPRN